MNHSPNGQHAPVEAIVAENLAKQLAWHGPPWN